MSTQAATAPCRESLLPPAKSWAVAWTKSRCEKALCEFLGAHGVPHFLPLVNRRRAYGPRVRFSQLPLFPGYVFFDVEAILKNLIFESRKVAQVLVPPDPERLRAELANFALALTADNSLRETHFGQVGKPVFIKAGPLQGLSGELVRMESRSRLIVRVSFIGKAAELEIDEAFIEPVL